MANTASSTRTRKLYAELASLVQACANCRESGSLGWERKHTERAESLVREHMPSGSGFDSGTQLDWGESTGDRLVFTTAFHHMNDHGTYCGWTEHSIIVRPAFSGISIRVTGRDRNDIRDYIAELADAALRSDIAKD